MKQPRFGGVGVALVTPFHANHEIDFEGLERLLVHTYANGEGVDYWVVQGTTGESATLQAQEKKQVLDFVKNHNPAQLPIVYGIGGNNTRAILDAIQQSDLDGVDALLSVSPYYNKPSQKGLIEHYTRIADASPCPVILYNVPGRTSSNVQASTTLELAQHPNIIAMKEASGDLVQCMHISKDRPDDFLLLSGEDLMTIPMISVGGNGVISVMANAFPEIFAQMTKAALQGDFQTAQLNLNKLLEVNPLMYEESNPVGVKYALSLLGVCQPHVRLPLVSASVALQEKIKVKMPVEVATH